MRNAREFTKKSLHWLLVFTEFRLKTRKNRKTNEENDRNIKTKKSRQVHMMVQSSSKAIEKSSGHPNRMHSYSICHFELKISSSSSSCSFQILVCVMCVPFSRICLFCVNNEENKNYSFEWFNRFTLRRHSAKYCVLHRKIMIMIIISAIIIPSYLISSVESVCLRSTICTQGTHTHSQQITRDMVWTGMPWVYGTANAQGG